ncbi:hypothetical protein, partial [Homoserinimonas sp. OAct 916]|uniref:hypothetical protein n=1 Tax=Homoserinimonas sp. OAct 916 TaxID=2211450 RepID=UPI001E2C6428
LIDTGADCNTISFELFQQLKGVELQPTNATLKAFTNHSIKARGTSELIVFVDELICGDKFFVIQAGM